MVREEHPRVRVIEMGSNTGFARANNRAIAASGGRFMLLLNPDTMAAPESIDRLAAFLDRTPLAGVAAPRLLNSDLTDQGTARSFPTAAAAIFGRRSALSKLFPNNRWSRRYLAGRSIAGPEPFEVDWVSGAALMVRREVVERVGGLDEGFFMHWEDADWCHRIKDAGYRVYCVPAAEIVHAEGGSRRGWPPRQLWAFHRGAYRYYAKHHAKQAWNPLRYIALVGLTVRGLAMITIASLVADFATSARSARGNAVNPVGLEAIRRNFRLIVIVAIGAMIVAYAGSYLFGTVYSATTTILVRAREARFLTSTGQDLSTQPGVIDSSLAKALSQTNSGLIKSREVAERVVNELKLDTPRPESGSIFNAALSSLKRAFNVARALIAHGFYAEPSSRYEGAVASTQGQLSATPIKDSYLIEVKASAGEAKLAAAMADAASDALLDVSKTRFQQDARTYRDFLKERVDTARAEVDAAERVIQRL